MSDDVLGLQTSQTMLPISYQQSSSVENGTLLQDDEERGFGSSENKTSAQPPSTKQRIGSRRFLWKRRSSSFLQSIQRAFHISYESVSGHDDQCLEDEEEEYGSDIPCCFFFGTCGFAIVAVMCSLAVLFVLVFRSHHSPPDQPQSELKHEYTGEEEPGFQSMLSPLETSFVASGLKRGAVATDHPHCSQMGLEVLRNYGGNAADAAVTVALCLGVANPASSGLGGGAFVLIHSSPPKKDQKDDASTPPFHDARTNQQHSSSRGRKRSEVIDCREVASAAAFRDMYINDTAKASIFGGLAIPVPGELRCLELAHARYGRLPWATVVQPVVELQELGVVVNANLAFEIKVMASLRWDGYKGLLRSMLTVGDTWDHPLKEGDRLFRPQFAETLAAIRDQGADALYTGDVAKRLAKDIQDAGGIVTAHDLENYRATLRSPVIGRGINGITIMGVPPPSSGGAAIIGAARFLAGFSNPLAMFRGTLSAHRIVEALKHVFAIRMSLSDPDYNSDVVADAVHDLVEGDYMDQLRRHHYLDNSTQPMSSYGGEKWAQLKDSDGNSSTHDAKEGDRRRLRRKLAKRFGYLNDHGTSHFVVVDDEGNAISATSSVNTYFGSTVVSPSTGVLLSNTMDDFANPGRPNVFGLLPSEANFIAPGKKPLSSMSPTMVFRENDGNGLGELLLVLGASGGPKILSAVTNVIVNHLWLGMSLFQSIVHPRLHDQLIYHGSAVTTCDNSIAEGLHLVVSNRTKRALEKRGHDLLDNDYMGTVQAISIDFDTREMTAACDIRKGGSPAGY